MALKIWKTRSTFAALSLMLAITSCQREALVEDVTLVTQEATSPLETPELAGLEQPMAETRSAVQYYVTPTVGTYTPNSTTSHTLPGKDGCASFHGGRIKARVKSQNGNNFVVEIATQSDSSFGINGQAYVKAYSVCGPIAGNTSFVRTDKTIEITITPTFKQGIAHYYPVIIDAKGFRYYAEPLLVYTVPMHSTRYGYGVHLGTVNGVTVYGAGAANIAEEGHNYYQCVEFCRRYYKEIYNLPFSGWGDAYKWFSNLDTRFNKYPNNGSIPPQIGDIICMAGGKKNLGHVAIIIEVERDYIKIAQQNSSTTWNAIGGIIKRQGNNLTVNNYTVQGWLRKK